MKAIVQIAHGMAEHAGRYRDFAEVLTCHGYGVYAGDHRGHGRTAKSTGLGYFGDHRGWELVIRDMITLNDVIRDEHPGVPVVLFGHSMGSFLGRRFVQVNGQAVDGAIFSGTGGDPGVVGALGVFIARVEMKRLGRRGKSKLLHNMSFGSYNKSFGSVRTEYDWLSRDRGEVDKYIADPLCGFVCTTAFFYDMLSGLRELNRPENVAKTPTDLPIYLFSGEKDPVGTSTKGVMEVYRRLKEAGVRDLEYRFYPEGRHEMLNELNKTQVYDDVINWLDTHVHETPREEWETNEEHQAHP